MDGVGDRPASRSGSFVTRGGLRLSVGFCESEDRGGLRPLRDCGGVSFAGRDGGGRELSAKESWDVVVFS